LSTGGQIIDAQSVIQPANGQDPLQWYKETLRYVVSPSEISGAQTDVKKVQFRFQANAENNAYLGWLIDDVAIGHDADRDTLPDELERNRLVVGIADSGFASLVIPPSSEAVSLIRGFQQAGAEQVILETIFSSTNRNQLSVEVGVASRWDSDRLAATSSKQVVVNLPTGFAASSGTAAVCSVMGPVQAGIQSWYDELGLHLFGSPIGYPNPSPTTRAYQARDPTSAYTASDSGVKMQIDLTHCLDKLASSAAFGSQPLDVYVKVYNGGSTAAAIESARIVSYGRTSMLSQDSDMDGAPDREGFPSTPIGVDADRDTVPASLDVEDNVQNLIPALDINLTKQASNIQFRLGNNLRPVTAQFREINGAGLSVTSMRTQGLWREWTVQVPSSASTLQASWIDESGATLTVDLMRKMVNNFPQVHSVTQRFTYDKYHVDSTWSYTASADGAGLTNILFLELDLYDVMSSGGNVRDALRTIDKFGVGAIPYVLAKEAGQAVVHHVVTSVLVAAVKDNLQYEFTKLNVGNQWRIDTPWRDPVNGKHYAVTLFNYPQAYNGVNTSTIQAYLGGSPKPYGSLGQTYRWLQESDGKVLLLTSDHAGRFLSGRQVTYESWPSILSLPYDALEASEQRVGTMLSVERNMTRQLYNFGSNYSRQMCHLACYPPGLLSSPIEVDSSFIQPTEGPGGQRRLFYEWGMTPALRQGNWSKNAGCCDRFEGENVLGMYSLLYTYRMAFASGNPKSDQFDAYWGNRSADPNCLTADHKVDRRCMNPALGNLDTSASRSTTGIEPFTVKWTRKDNGALAATDLVGAGGDYWFWGGSSAAQPDGHSLVAKNRDRVLNALGNYNTAGKTKVATAFDLTGPVLSLTPSEWQQRLDRPGSFGHGYGA
jgi:hypothetical protein